MIEAVCVQANKAYRMWCARNPGFDSKGRVHVIGHSVRLPTQWKRGIFLTFWLVIAWFRSGGSHPFEPADPDATHQGFAQKGNGRNQDTIHLVSRQRKGTLMHQVELPFASIATLRICFFAVPRWGSSCISTKRKSFPEREGSEP